MHTVKYLTNKKIKPDLLDDFLSYINSEMKIDTPYSVYFVEDKENASEALGKTAMYNPSTKSVYVYVTNRHPKDILRSIAHELVHHKQNCNGDLENMSLEKAEVQANAGGYYLRKYEDQLKENKLREAAGDYEKCLPHQNSYSTYCVPKGFDVSKSVLGGPDWTIEDVIEARKDLWVRQGNRVGENADMYMSKRKSVFERLKDPLLRKMVLDRYFFPMMELKIKEFKKSKRPPDYQNNENFKSYFDELSKTITDPDNIEFWDRLLLKFAGKKGFPKIDENELQKLAAERRREAKTDAVGLPKPLSGVDGATDYRNVWQQILDKQRAAKNESLDEQKSTTESFEVYGKLPTDGAYLITKLFDKTPVLRTDVLDDQVYSVSPKMAQSIIDTAKTGDQNNQDVKSKAAAIYGVSPFSEKSRRAINALDSKRERNLVIAISLLGAVPLPFFWISDVILATYYFNKAKEKYDKTGRFPDRELGDGLLSLGLAFGFSGAKGDIAKAINAVRGNTKIMRTTKLVNAHLKALKATDAALTKTENLLKKGQTAVKATPQDAANLVSSRLGKGDKTAKSIQDVLKQYDSSVTDALNTIAKKKEAIKREIEIFSEISSAMRRADPEAIKAAFAKAEAFSGKIYDNYGEWLARDGGRIHTYVKQNFESIMEALAKNNERVYDRIIRDFGGNKKSAVRALAKRYAKKQAAAQRELGRMNYDFMAAVGSHANRTVSGSINSTIDAQKVRTAIGEDLTSTVAPKEVADRIVTELSKDIGPGAAATRTEAALTKDLEQAAKGESNKLTEIFKEFEDEGADLFASKVYSELGKDFATMYQRALGAAAARFSAYSLMGTGALERAWKQYVTGGGYFRQAYNATQRLISKIATSAAGKLPKFAIPIEIAAQIPKLMFFIAYKFSVPSMIYLRFYRPICNVSYAEFVKALEVNGWASLLDPLAGAVKLASKSYDGVVTSIKNPGYKFFDPEGQLSKVLCKDVLAAQSKDLKYKKFVKKQFRKAVLETEAVVKKTAKSIKNNPELNRAISEAQAAAIELEKIVDLAKKDPEAAKKQLKQFKDKVSPAIQKKIDGIMSDELKKQVKEIEKASKVMLKSLQTDHKAFCDKPKNKNHFLCQTRKEPIDPQAARRRRLRGTAVDENKTLSDYREKLLNERLEKLTIGFTK